MCWCRVLLLTLPHLRFAARFAVLFAWAVLLAFLCSLPLQERQEQRGERSLQAQVRRSGAHPARAVKQGEVTRSAAA